MRRVLLPIILASLAVTISCSRLSVTPPQGFAEVKGGRSYRAVSPEGMLYSIRSIKNSPRKNLDFWGEALENHLVKEGYRLNGDGRSFTTSGELEGLSYEWVLPYGNESYLYLTAVIVTDRTITLAEAAAPYPVFIRYRQALVDSLVSIQPRR